VIGGRARKGRFALYLPESGMSANDNIADASNSVGAVLKTLHRCDHRPASVHALVGSKHLPCYAYNEQRGCGGYEN